MSQDKYGTVDIGLAADVVLNWAIEDVVDFLEGLRNGGYTKLCFDFDRYEGTLAFCAQRAKTREEFEEEQERERRLCEQRRSDRERQERAEYERLKAKFEPGFALPIHWASAAGHGLTTCGLAIDDPRVHITTHTGGKGVTCLACRAGIKTTEE